MADRYQIALLIAGNELRGDDAAAHLALPLIGRLPSAVGLWTGPDFLAAVPDLATGRLIVIADAVRGGRPPGSVATWLIRPDEPLPAAASLHDCGPLAAIALARTLGGQAPALLIGIEPECLDGVTLSASVSASLSAFAAAIRSALSWPNASARFGIGNPERPLPEGCPDAHLARAEAMADAGPGRPDSARGDPGCAVGPERG